MVHGFLLACCFGVDERSKEEEFRRIFGVLTFVAFGVSVRRKASVCHVMPTFFHDSLHGGRGSFFWNLEGAKEERGTILRVEQVEAEVPEEDTSIEVHLRENRSLPVHSRQFKPDPNPWDASP